MSISNKVFSTNSIRILLISCLGTLNVLAQESGLTLDANLGSNPTSPLKAFHSGLTEQVDFENFKTTDNFYINYGFSVGFTLGDINSSFFYANRVSGAKTSVADYSGFISLTNELKGHTLGYKYYRPLTNRPKSNLFLQFKGLVTFSTFTVTSDTATLGGSQQDSLDFKATDLGVGTGILYEYPLGFMVLRAYLDVDIYYGGKIKLKEDNPDGGFLLNENRKKLTTGWGGLTSGLGATIPL